MLALDLYFRLGVSQRAVAHDHPAVLELSAILNSLPIHRVRPDSGKFRNANGVNMKLCNFLRFDPIYEGAELRRGGRAEKAVSDEFAGDEERLSLMASAIREAVSSTATRAMIASAVDEEEAWAVEGRVLHRLHRLRERQPALVRRKKTAALRHHGRLVCEV